MNKMNWIKYLKNEYFNLYIMFVRSEQTDANYSHAMGRLHELRNLFCKLHIYKILPDDEFNVFVDIDSRIYCNILCKYHKTKGVA
jgi:hypothetical protein